MADAGARAALSSGSARATLAAMAAGALTHSILGRAARLALDAVLPPRCLGCGAVVDAQGALCAECWPRLRFLGPPWCACCGLPFEFDVGEGALCGACSREKPAFDRARAALAYDDGSRPLLLAFKHGDATHSAPAYGAWLRRVAADLVAETDLIAPVPLHRWRLLRRRYNQAALLALALAREAGRPAVPDLLVRRRATPSQAGRSRSGRARNVQGAFAVRPSRSALAEGRRVLLVDDVATTGATVEECARALKRAGAAAVFVVTLARVLRPVV
ncbi:MAG TPA: ComF family protein [Alphaproteobacteria bacterium]|nr:ComF family protein [Alphaproteobacteria bacterium]